MGAEASGVLRSDYLILGGDLNITLNAMEVWGDKARLDFQADFETYLEEW